MFLSFSIDSLLSFVSRDVFTCFLARSVQELWLIKGLPATIVASTNIKSSFSPCYTSTNVTSSFSPCYIAKSQWRSKLLFSKKTGQILDLTFSEKWQNLNFPAWNQNLVFIYVKIPIVFMVFSEQARGRHMSMRSTCCHWAPYWRTLLYSSSVWKYTSNAEGWNAEVQNKVKRKQVNSRLEGINKKMLRHQKMENRLFHITA